jgi:hypothetical protein
MASYRLGLRPPTVASAGNPDRQDMCRVLRIETTGPARLRPRRPRASHRHQTGAGRVLRCLYYAALRPEEAVGLRGDDSSHPARPGSAPRADVAGPRSFHLADAQLVTGSFHDGRHQRRIYPPGMPVPARNRAANTSPPRPAPTHHPPSALLATRAPRDDTLRRQAGQARQRHAADDN